MNMITDPTDEQWLGGMINVLRCTINTSIFFLEFLQHLGKWYVNISVINSQFYVKNLVCLLNKNQ